MTDIPHDTILSSFVSFSLVSTCVIYVIYYIKVVRKIDSILKKNKINKNRFDITWARVNLYRIAIINPEKFKKKYPEDIFFDPIILKEHITRFDKWLAKYESISFYIFVFFALSYSLIIN